MGGYCFDGVKVTWNGQTFVLDENTFLLDGSLSAEDVQKCPYVFNEVRQALAALKSGTAQKPMMLLTAPGVYWIEDPDSDVVRDGKNGPSENGLPVGVRIAVDHLHFYGLTEDPEDVVFASNRGQQMGAQGNYTMFMIEGVGLRSENVTFGNYCNVDLEYKRDPSLSRRRRSDAITQAQLFAYKGNDGVAINTRFISRLNLRQFARYFYKCYLESGGHAGGGYYVDCTLRLFNYNFAGANFFNCDVIIDSYDHIWKGQKVVEFGFVDGIGDGLIAVDTRFHRAQKMKDAGTKLELAWDNLPRRWTSRAYQYNVTLDGEPYVIQEYATPGASVVVKEGTLLAKAFKVGEYYNLPNITGADPFGVGEKIGEEYMNIPVKATASLSTAVIRSGQEPAILTFGAVNHPAPGKWTIKPSVDCVNIVDNGDGTATVYGTNEGEYAEDIIIEVENELGIKAAAALKVEPAYVSAPAFVGDPVITAPVNGVVSLEYELELAGRQDQSVINWYRCMGDQLVALTVSRRDIPEKSYVLSMGDVGYPLAAEIYPKHNRSERGKRVIVQTAEAIKAEDVVGTTIKTDFLNLPTADQHELIPGTWSLDGYSPAECTKQPYVASEENNWDIVVGKSGALGRMGLVNSRQGARICYTPVGEKFGDMKTVVQMVPFKDAGQGFGSANNQFVETYVKFDRNTMTGYAVRLERLTLKDVNELGQDGNGAAVGVAVSLVEYKNGVPTHISDRIMTSAFADVVTVEIEAKGGLLTACVSSAKEGSRGGDAFGYAREVHLSATYEENGLGGTGLQNTGTTDPYKATNCNYVMLLGWETQW